MRIQAKLCLLVSACLLTMCKTYHEPTIYTNGLSCQNYTDYRFFERRGEEYNAFVREEGADCTYTCASGTEKETNIAGTISSLYASSRDELEARLCGVASLATPQQPLPTTSPTATSIPSVTSTTSPIPTASATIAATSVPLFTGVVSMCDLGDLLINFRIVESPPDLTGRSLEVQIAEQESTCYVNPVNPSLMTCTIPIGVSFPASILVRLDGALVNEFIYSGVGCLVLPTQTSTPRPIISYP